MLQRPFLPHRSRPIWLVVNAASGSNSDSAIAAVKQVFADHGHEIDRLICFPDEKLPTRNELATAGVGIVGVFAGDGTVNALVTALFGWDGSILVLPGGTMNLLSLRLHGEAEAAAIIRRLFAGQAVSARPTVAACRQGVALAGLMAGPATAWGDVREAMRDGDVVGVAQSVTTAIERSVSGPSIGLREPPVAMEHDYALLMLTPLDGGLAVDGFYAETVADLFGQGAALLKRAFRDGPHDRVGLFSKVAIASDDGAALDLLIDGEAVPGDALQVVELVECEVDLLASAPQEIA